MGKVKIKLVSGSEMEKPVLNAFKADNNSYVVLDNESTGSMGLPIILVCKLIDNKLIKIIDQVEWQKTKESLKSIIANGPMEYINVSSDLAADDVYYTQLTLPIASYDALKNNYKPVGDASVASAPVVETPVMPMTEPVVSPVTPINIEPVAPVIEPAGPVMPEVVVPSEPVLPEIPTVAPVVEPVVAPVEITPVMPVVEPVIAPIEPVVPVVEPVVAPVIPDAPAMPEVAPVVSSESNNTINYDEMKESFMKSCENMFDALVKKFENKE